MSVTIRRARTHQCVGCGRRIPWWWFSLGDDQGHWHVLCMIRDEASKIG